MAKTILSVEDVLNEMKASRNEKGKINYNRFNKKNFEKLMKAMFNDPKFTTKVAHVKKGKLDTVEEIEVSKKFRNFVKKCVEKSGVDKKESERILTEEFTVDSTEGLYEFFATALYLYIEQGNRFDLLPKEDFKGSIFVKECDESSKTSKAYSPQSREYLGDYKTTKKKHKELGIKTKCPDWLTSREKVK